MREKIPLLLVMSNVLVLAGLFAVALVFMKLPPTYIAWGFALFGFLAFLMLYFIGKRVFRALGLERVIICIMVLFGFLLLSLSLLLFLA